MPNDKSECDEKQLISDCPHILFVHRKTTIKDHDRHHRTMTIINNMDPKRQEKKTINDHDRHHRTMTALL